MVEHRPLSDIIAYAILTLGIFIVAFPVYLALIASTHDAATVVGGHMPLTPGGHMLDNYYRAIFVGAPDQFAADWKEAAPCATA